MASAAVDFEAAKAALQKKGAAGNSVYDHLVDVIQKIVTEDPSDAVGLFESLSSSVKQAKFDVAASTSASGGASAAADPAVKAAQDAWAASTEALFKAPEPADGVDEPAPVQDLTDEANYLEWAGVGIGREEAFRLHLALKHLAAKVPVTGLRFFGKVSNKDGCCTHAHLMMHDADCSAPSTCVVLLCRFWALMPTTLWQRVFWQVMTPRSAETATACWWRCRGRAPTSTPTLCATMLAVPGRGCRT